ncbi:MAG: DUF2280 domain-containing protein [Alcanivoracaceae bacterium]|nr:DUF2280 domain-containing protein [Alcanivoracaceae bacterium]
MARLKSEIRKFLVQRLACFDAPAEVKKEAQHQFGVVISRQQVQSHDPTKRAGRNLSRELKALFNHTREAFLENTADIAVSHKAVRLRALQRMFERAEETGNLVLAAQLLEQAAKESGDAYTNKRRHEVTGRNGGPIQQESRTYDFSQMSTGALKELANARLDNVHPIHTKPKKPQ